jgi:predicted lipoprotein with Yx(FWY)xxD motif
VGRVGLLIAAALAAPSIAAAAVKPPVIRLPTHDFGPILARQDHQALYYWTTEKRAGGKIRCTGACAALWPPLLVQSAAAVRKQLPGVTGTLGVVRRPEGTLQVTWNGLPVYTYVHEGHDQVLCDDVQGWFVVRLRS